MEWCKNSQLNERKTKSNKVTNHKGWSQFTQFLHTKHFLQLCCFLNLCKGRITCLLLKITFAELVPTSFGTRRSTLCHIFRATPQCPQLFPNAPQHPTAIQTACTCATRRIALAALCSACGKIASMHPDASRRCTSFEVFLTSIKPSIEELQSTLCIDRIRRTRSLLRFGALVLVESPNLTWLPPRPTVESTRLVDSPMLAPDTVTDLCVCHCDLPKPSTLPNCLCFRPSRFQY